MTTPEVGGNNPVRVKIVPQGEHTILLKKENEVLLKINEKVKDICNLVSTDAGSQALSMAKDSHDKYGTEPGMIDARVWNPYAKAHGGKTISGSISQEDAMKSITTYTVREQAKAKKAQAEELKANSDTGEKPEQGI